MRTKLLLAIFVLCLVGALFTNAPYQWLTQRTLDSVLIKDKQVSTESDREDGKVRSTYMIYTDAGVLRNDDAGWFAKFNSSDIYGELDIGKRYRMKIYGWRIPILSMYPNIVSIQSIEPKAENGNNQ